jgi:hypothetical protein
VRDAAGEDSFPVSRKGADYRSCELGIPIVGTGGGSAGCLDWRER